MSDDKVRQNMEDEQPIEANSPEDESAHEPNAEATFDEALEAGDFGDDSPLTRDEEMEALRRTAEEADKRVLMAQAEADNFRKRLRRDYEDQLKYASIPLVTDLLQVRDNLLRAIEAADGGSDGGLKEGVEMVVKMLDDNLAKHGIIEIPADSVPFDPNVHEAISQMPSPDHESGAIVHVATAGFKLHDRVIRPSQVVVAQ